MQYNLGLVEFLLDLHDAVGLPRILVLDNVLIELGQHQGRRALGPFSACVRRQEIIDHLREQLVRDELGVLVVRYDDAGDAL